MWSASSARWRIAQAEDIQIPEDIDYLKIHGLRTEPGAHVRPINLARRPAFLGFHPDGVLAVVLKDVKKYVS